MKADLFLIILFLSAFNTGMFFLAEKWGLLQKAREKAPFKFLYQLLMCEFCTFFWASMIELHILYISRCDVQFFFILSIIPVSICCAVFSKFFLRSNQ